MKQLIFFLITTVFCSCNHRKSDLKFSMVEIVRDSSNKIVMIKSGIADENNARVFKYYDTTGRLLLVIDWGGLDKGRRMYYLQAVDTIEYNSIRSGELFYKEFLSPLFGQVNNYRNYLALQTSGLYLVTDSIIYKNYNFRLSSGEFENLKNYIK